MRCRLSVFLLFIFFESFSQTQTCPVNINFATGDLTHWFAYTGNNMDGYGADAIVQDYDSTTGAPRGTIGTRVIQEYNLPSYQGIQVLTTSQTDPFGLFPTIPTINGYAYNYSIKLGSTAITRGNGLPGSGGGYYQRCELQYKSSTRSGNRALYHDVRIRYGTGERNAYLRLSTSYFGNT